MPVKSVRRFKTSKTIGDKIPETSKRNDDFDTVIEEELIVLDDGEAGEEKDPFDDIDDKEVEPVKKAVPKKAKKPASKIVTELGNKEEIEKEELGKNPELAEESNLDEEVEEDESPVKFPLESVKQEDSVNLDKIANEIPVESNAPSNLHDLSEVEEDFSPPNKSRNILWFIVPVILLLSVLTAGVLIFNQGSKKETLTTPEPSITPTPEASPSAVPVDVTLYKIKILNGSGIKGEAARMQDVLEAENFVVSSVGNAQTADYTDTIIEAKAGTPKGFIDKIKEFLRNDFVIAEGERLEETVDIDVVITLGSKKSE